MDKLLFVSGTLFLASDIFAIMSLSLPYWIVDDVGGSTAFGLLLACETLYNRPKVCYHPKLGGAWLVTLGCILVGCLCVTATIFLLVLSHITSNRVIMSHARWVGFSAMVLFCLAAVIFPIGFHSEEIGGQAYQLPNSYQVGLSYIFFIFALWTTVVSELFAGKVCLPHF